jgi:Protein of unknown function (DUF3500)
MNPTGKRSWNLVRLAVAVICVVGMAGVAMIARDERPVAESMADAAEQFLQSLSPELRQKVEFGYDDPHRVNWFFTPQQDKEKRPTRKGIRFEELDEPQKAKALALLRTGTSAKGYEQATTIMSLEGILREAETKGAMVRNPNWYFLSIFGKPSKTGQWGWRLEGHHLALSFTLDKGQVESPTPFFFGANPATVKNGAKAGLRPIPEVEDLAQELIKSLDDDQKKVAFQGAKPFAEIAENAKSAKLDAPVGLTVAKLNEAQQKTIQKLIEVYANRMPQSVAESELAKAKAAGPEKIFFAYTGEPAPGKGYTYRIHGPTFVVQFLNVQADGYGNPNNHIHSVWRRLPVDFGLKSE